VANDVERIMHHSLVPTCLLNHVVHVEPEHGPGERAGQVQRGVAAQVEIESKV